MSHCTLPAIWVPRFHFCQQKVSLPHVVERHSTQRDYMSYQRQTWKHTVLKNTQPGVTLFEETPSRARTMPQKKQSVPHSVPYCRASNITQVSRAQAQPVQIDQLVLRHMLIRSRRAFLYNCHKSEWHADVGQGKGKRPLDSLIGLQSRTSRGFEEQQSIPISRFFQSM